MALISLQDVTIAFSGLPLLDGVSLQIRKGEKLCLLGRNGTGKTTLIKLVNHELEPDKGTITRQQGITTTHLPQEIPQGITGQVFDVVLEGLGKQGKVKLDEEDDWENFRQAETVISRMKLEAEALFETLSAGLKRRVLLARALVCKPDILLLDEPTNHLDIDAITWLEDFLMRYQGTLVFVTHDRMLIKKLASRIIELDRGKLFNWACDYQTYLERKEAALEAEKEQWAVFDKKLAKEEQWIRQGIKARRTRNEGRVKALLKMREQRRVRREHMGTAQVHLQQARRSGRLVIETENVRFQYPGPGEKLIIRDFSTFIMRGDRVGIIGPNGSGKTTLLRVLLNRLKPQQGTVRLGTHLEVIYFDQLRDRLDEEKTVQDNVADGNERVVIHGKTRHIIGYLRDFLFTPERSRTPVKVLSGGERSRLLLAKLFAKPSNLLVMDEPTNDLDVETLELLEDLLIGYKGTLLLVSHDRTFLNNVVTSTLVLEGEGQVNEYIGGYDDWLRQQPSTAISMVSAHPAAAASGAKEKHNKPRQRSRKLTNKERQELETLPQHIEELEAEQEQLYNAVADPEFYKQDSQTITNATTRLEALKQELARAYQRWEELELLKTNLLQK